MKAKFLCILLVFICLITLSCLDEETLIDGNFELREYDSSYKIVGLSEEGKTKSHVVVPNTYKGKKLWCKVYNPWVAMEHLSVCSNDAIRVYFGSNHFYYDCDIYDFKKIMFLYQDANIISEYHPFEDNQYICSNVFFEYAKLRNITVINNSIIDFFEDRYRPANVSFNYNYEGSPNNGYYWIDDYSDELIEYKPKNPIRIGYGFMGWYKEPECINEWDFEEDIVPKKIYVDKYIESKQKTYRFYEYKETILYAKWV